MSSRLLSEWIAFFRIEAEDMELAQAESNIKRSVDGGPKLMGRGKK